MQPRTPKSNKSIALIVSAYVLLNLAACGGGGGSSTTSSTPSSGDAATVSSAPGAVALAGVVSGGGTWVGASVSVKCATGTTSETIQPNGSYKINMQTAALPCVLSATSSDGNTTLHSVATGSGAGNGTADITPITELLVAQLTGKNPSTYYSSVDISTLATTVTGPSVSAAQTKVLNTLTDGGVNVSSVSNVLTDSIVSGSGTGYTAALNNVATALSTQSLTLSALTTTVANTSAGASSSSSTTVALPASLQLKAADSTCSALRSTTFYVIRSVASTNGQQSSDLTQLNNDSGIVVAQYDASTRALSITGGSTHTLTPTANTTNNCKFTTSDGSTVVVSPAGVFVASIYDAAGYYLAVGLPKQTHTVDELAGNWNLLGSDEPGVCNTTWCASYSALSIDASGKIVVNSSYYFQSTDTTATSSGGGYQALITQNSVGGGFYATGSDGSGSRVYAYQSGNGDIVGVHHSLDGSISFLTKASNISLPAVSSGESYWDLSILLASQRTSSGVFTSYSDTVSAVNSSAGSYTRLTSINGSTDTYPETISINTPNTGFYTRSAITSELSSAGNPVSVRPFIAIHAPSFGLSLHLLPYVNSTSLAVLSVSVAQSN